jgi:hypothetical protein
MEKRDKQNISIKTSSVKTSHDDLENHQLPADYNAMNWEEFFEIFKQRQPVLYNKFVNK